MVLIIMTAIFFIILSFAILYEKREYNNGICKHCGKKLRCFDIDSQGGRLYTCEDMHTLVSVSYNCVDRFNHIKKIERRNNYD